MMTHIESLLVQGAYTTTAFCYASDAFVVTLRVLGSRLIELSCLGMLCSLLFGAACVRRGYGIIVHKPGRGMLLLMAVVLTQMVMQRLAEVDLALTYHRLEALWLVFSGFVSVVAVLALPTVATFEPPPGSNQ